MLVTLFKSAPVNYYFYSAHNPPPDNDTNDDKFASALLQANFATKIIPTVAFEFCSLDILWRELQDPDHLSGMIFTSPRCVESVRRSVDSMDCEAAWNDHLKDAWIDKPMYCVGPSTRDAVVQLFAHNSLQQTRIFVSEKGNSESLANRIIQESLSSRIEQPLLYPCGSLKTDTLGSMLSKENIPWKAVTVYETVPNPDLHRNLEAAGASSGEKEQTEEAYVFFSPSGLRYALPYLKDLDRKKFVALGPTTREALEKTPSVPSTHIYQCESPTPEALVKLLNSIAP